LNVLHHIHVDDFKCAVEELGRITDKYLVLEIRNKNNIFDQWYNKIIMPKYYDNLPSNNSSVNEVNTILKKNGFKPLVMRGEKVFYWTCRRLVIMYKRI